MEKPGLGDNRKELQAYSSPHARTRGSDQESENSLHVFVVCPPEHDRQLNKVNFKKCPEWKVAGGKDKRLLQILRP